MYTIDALLDLHERSHRSLQKLLVHCSALRPEELHKELTGFGYPSIQLQFYHLIFAERYWIGVLEGRIDVDENPSAYPSTDSLDVYRNEIFEATEHHLRAASVEELNTARTMMTWRNKEQLMKPAHVLIRTQTHIYHHQGQILAMCRILGKPGAAGLDFPLT